MRLPEFSPVIWKTVVLENRGSGGMPVSFTQLLTFSIPASAQDRLIKTTSP